MVESTPHPFRKGRPLNVMTKSLAVVALGALIPLGVALPGNAAGQITFAVDAPAVQGSFVDGVTLENFDDGCTSPLAIGTFTGWCGSSNALYYAGASSESGEPFEGGVGTPFAGVGPGYEVNIELDGPANYLGFHWQAGNEYDRVRLYSGETLLADFSFETLMAALDGAELATIGGGAYATEDYFGNPVNGEQAHEPYAYVHIFASEGVTFDRVVMSEDAGSPGVFEFDNMAVGFAEVADFVDAVSLDVVTVESDETESLAETGFDLNGLALVSVVVIAAGVAARIRYRRRATVI